MHANPWCGARGRSSAPCVRWAFFAAGLAGLACTAVRLLSVPGVESAFVLGLFLPPFVAAGASQRVWRASRDGLGVSAMRHLGRNLGFAVAVTALPTTLLLLTGLRTRLCEPGLGLAFLTLGPLAGNLLAAMWGTITGGVGGPERRAIGLAVMAPLAAIALGLERFWSTPAIFVYSPFAGYFPGTIYDRKVALPTAYLTYRASSALALFSGSLFFIAGWDRGFGRLRWARLAAHAGLTAIAAIGLAGVLTVWSEGAALGHRTSAAHIADVLGAEVQGERCVLHVPRETPERLRRLWRLDCDFQVERIEGVLGVHHPDKVQAYFYRSADEKRALMGAGRTQIAKPWRGEVHVQIAEWPHPVLGHELVHVLGSRTGVGPFAISGSFGGLLPNPGLIEGLAVGTAWDVREGLDPDQWSKAMLEIDRLPRLRDVFGLRFTTLPPRNAYEAAGSFVRFVRAERGADAVRRMYLEGDVEAALGERLESLERAWRRHLRAIHLPEGTAERARARFADRSVFSSVCPHEVAALHHTLAEDLAAGDHRGAVRTCEAILSIDPADLTAAVQRIGALSSLGRILEAEAELTELEVAGVPAPMLADAQMAFADGLWTAGEEELAAQTYGPLLRRPIEEDVARAIEVRLLALQAPPNERESLRQILVGFEGQRITREAVVYFARELSRIRADGLGPYLEGRQMFFASRYDEAASLFEQAAKRGLPTPRLRRETARLRVTSLAAIGAFEPAMLVVGSFDRDPYLAPIAEIWRERLRYMATRRGALR